MEKELLFIIEGKNKNEISYNFRSIIGSLFKYGATVPFVNNHLAVFKNGLMKLETDVKAYDVDKFIIMIFSLKVESLDLFNDYYKNGIDQDEAILSNEYKFVSFEYSKETFLAVMNSVANNIIENYRKNYEEKGIEMNVNDLPFIIFPDKNYKIPVELYNHLHLLEKYINRYFREIEK